MNTPVAIYPNTSLDAIHHASLELLRDPGVGFHSSRALAIFKRYGATVSGKSVMLSPAMIQRALDVAPREFVIRARHPEKSVRISSDSLSLAPGYGAVFVIATDGSRRRAVLADYHDFCKLVQTSSVMDLNGFVMVEPSDIPPEAVHLEMLSANLTLCDKPFMGCPFGAQGARDSLEMARIVMGDLAGPVMLSIINSQPPLSFIAAAEEALIEFAEAGQAILIHGGGMMGANAPIQLPGLLSNQNAVFLAGLTLAQLVRPGTPTIYGVSGSAINLHTGGFQTGGPEPPQAAMIGAQMAKLYGLPCRGGGCATDSPVCDLQAGVQSAMFLLGPVLAGVNFVMHAGGMLDSLMSMSFEKFLADEELCGQVLHVLNPRAVLSETLDLDVVREVGPGGQYLSHWRTARLCRQAFYPARIFRQPRSGEAKAEPMGVWQKNAAAVLKERLAQYQAPYLDPARQQALNEYINRRRRELLHGDTITRMP